VWKFIGFEQFSRFVHIRRKSKIEARHSGHPVVVESDKVAKVRAGERDTTVQVNHQHACILKRHLDTFSESGNEGQYHVTAKQTYLVTVLFAGTFALLWTHSYRGPQLSKIFSRPPP